MAQLTAPGTRSGRARTMRAERVVQLRQTMPRGYVTLRKEIPVRVTGTTTPKVDASVKADETAAGKGA